MRSYLLTFASIEVTKDFTEVAKDGSGRDLRALCGSEPGVCNAAGGDGKRFCPGRVECTLSWRGGGAIRTGVVVFHPGRCDQLGRVPNHAIDTCSLWALARPHSGIGQSTVRQAQSCRGFDLACLGATHSARNGNSDRADKRMPGSFVAWLPCADSRWQSPQWQRTSPWGVAGDGCRGFARSKPSFCWILSG